MSKALTFSKQAGGNLEHNNRTEKKYRDNIDTSRTKDNITLVNIPIKEFYEQEFGAAVKKYNDKQKRTSRKIGSYLEKVKEDKKLNEFYELVVQIGDMHDTNCKDNPLNEIELLKKYVSDFQERYPNLKVFNAVIHLDEETPHLHLDYVPITENCQKGMEKQTSQSRAFAEIFPEMQGSGKAHEKFLEVERNNLGELMKEFNIEQTPPEKSHGNLSVAQYKVAAKIGTSLSQKFIDNINKKQLDMNFKNVLGKKIITDTQIEDINDKLSLKDFEIDKLKLKVSELISGIEQANKDKENFMRNNLSKKYVTQEILVGELEKELKKVNAELQNIKNTPNSELIAAKKKIKELELAAQKKKEQEDKKVSALKVQQEIDRAAKKRLEDKISILDKDNLKLQGDILKERTDRVDTWDYLWNVISNIAVKLFSEDFSFQEVVDRIKEDFFDKKGVISYQDHNNQKKDLIVEIVSDVADKIELDKKTVKSKENGRQ